jgi:hypothetical protein
MASGLFVRCGLYPYETHHSTIDVLHDVTVKRKRPHNARITEIHAQGHAWVWSESAPRRNVDCIPQSRFLPTDSPRAYYDEMQLMRVERMGFLRAVFDSPVLNISLTNREVGLCRMRIEEYGRVTFFCNEEERRALWIARID